MPLISGFLRRLIGVNNQGQTEMKAGLGGGSSVWSVWRKSWVTVTQVGSGGDENSLQAEYCFAALMSA